SSPAAIADDRGGARPLGAVRDEQGTVSTFIVNEVLIAPKDQAELDAFLARYQATVVADNAVPPPPAALGITLDPALNQATEYTVRVDASRFGLSRFESDARAAGIGGTVAISSEAAAELLALVVHESSSGLKIGPNFVFESHG